MYMFKESIAIHNTLGRAHTATMSMRPCVSKTQKRGSHAHTRPRTRVDVKLSHKLYELQFVSKRVRAFPNKVVARFGCNFSHVAFWRKCLVARILEVDENNSYNRVGLDSSETAADIQALSLS